MFLATQTSTQIRKAICTDCYLCISVAILDGDPSFADLNDRHFAAANELSEFQKLYESHTMRPVHLNVFENLNFLNHFANPDQFVVFSRIDVIVKANSFETLLTRLRRCHSTKTESTW